MAPNSKLNPPACSILSLLSPNVISGNWGSWSSSSYLGCEIGWSWRKRSRCFCYKSWISSVINITTYKAEASIRQCCATRVHVTRTRTRVQCFSLWLGLGLRNRDSDPSHARVQAVAAVLCCAVYSDIRYILLFVFMFWKINKCWICGLLDSWVTNRDSDSIFFFDSDSPTRRWWLGLRLWGDDSDSEMMTRTRIWQPGLGHSTAIRGGGGGHPHLGGKHRFAPPPPIISTTWKISNI